MMKSICQLLSLCLLVILSGTYVQAQQLTLYKSYDGHLYTRQQVDSVTEQVNNRVKAQGQGAYWEVVDKQRRQDTLLCTFSINRASQSMVDDHARLLQFVGKPLPAFELRDLAGQVVKSAALRGQPAVLNMWFTTCTGCIAEMPALNTVMADPANKHIRFLSLTYEKPAAVTSFLQKRTFTFRHIPDAKAYCGLFTQAYPITIFVDKQGIISAIQGGLPFMNPDSVSTKRIATAAGNDYVDATALYMALDDIR